jgi:hypothetical protein
MIAFGLAAAPFLFFSTAPAEAAMYADTQERRDALLGTFIVVSALVGALCLLFAVLAQNCRSIEEPQTSSVVVPPIKQESNIVRHLVTA